MQNKRNTKTITGLKVGIPFSQLVSTNVIPSSDNFFNIGSSNLRWRNLYAYKGDFSNIVDIKGLLKTSGGNHLKGGSLVRGGMTIREGIVAYDGLSVDKSLLCSGPFIATGTANFEGYTHIKTPVYKNSITLAEARDILRNAGPNSIIGPYKNITGLIYYYRTDISNFYYITPEGVPF